jgi:hypothetical protein
MLSLRLVLQAGILADQRSDKVVSSYPAAEMTVEERERSRSRPAADLPGLFLSLLLENGPLGLFLAFTIYLWYTQQRTNHADRQRLYEVLEAQKQIIADYARASAEMTASVREITQALRDSGEELRRVHNTLAYGGGAGGGTIIRPKEQS